MKKYSTAQEEASRIKFINAMEIAFENMRDDDCEPEIDQSKVIIREPIMIREDRSKPSNNVSLWKRFKKLMKKF